MIDWYQIYSISNQSLDLGVDHKSTCSQSRFRQFCRSEFIQNQIFSARIHTLRIPSYLHTSHIIRFPLLLLRYRKNTTLVTYFNIYNSCTRDWNPNGSSARDCFPTRIVLFSPNPMLNWNSARHVPGDLISSTIWHCLDIKLDKSGSQWSIISHYFMFNLLHFPLCTECNTPSITNHQPPLSYNSKI